MATEKLPSYPLFSLPEALEKVRRLYDSVHRRRLSREEIAKLLGYTGLNGASMTVLANIGKYGLLEGRGDQIRVSDTAAVILIEDRGAPDRVAALKRAAIEPELFRALEEQFEGGPTPTENTIRIRLEKMGLAPKAASAAARAYRETMEFVAGEGGAYNEFQAENDGQEDSMPTTIAAPVTPVSQSFAHPQPLPGKFPTPSMVAADPGSVLFLQVPFKGTTLSVRIEASGQTLTKAHVAKVGQYLKLAEDDLELAPGGTESEA